MTDFMECFHGHIGSIPTGQYYLTRVLLSLVHVSYGQNDGDWKRFRTPFGFCQMLSPFSALRGASYDATRFRLLLVCCVPIPIFYVTYLFARCFSRVCAVGFGLVS
ncbi:hypothetical protein K474DRAFT_1662672 [Panus rudis PR-1116 ss-1]|nr:hypothetical protein K474DRAFT_1662672 [Panus rudis PR-1116 ss-1]